MIDDLRTETENLISDHIIEELEKFYPSVTTGSMAAEYVHGRGYVKQTTYGSNWKYYDKHDVFLGVCSKQADAWAKLLIYLCRNINDNRDEL